ncbi:probable serine/threonine-protein kinase DDB_G0283337 isoform X2 [Cotesia glomerata]|uniref:probable serine/threonine-protein kinase DDB_G0283337 isoform X2 n=1 Tax=Cotesia glomerata TaxID=32391 RepID=UPI001D00F63E|nr:probable serine/threonine-protein kinase DDB_G0283337 isoform X2 [Cotesia glomerata]
MTGKNQEATDNSDATKIKIITEKIKSLEDNVTKVRKEVSNCFEDLKNSIMAREKQLLRQIEAIHNQQLSIIQSDWKLVNSIPAIGVDLVNDCKDISLSIIKLGKIEFPDSKDNLIVKNIEPYSIHEYEDDKKDHITFDKSIQVNENYDNIIIKLSDVTFSNVSKTDNSSDSILKSKINLSSQLSLDYKTDNDCSPLCSKNNYNNDNLINISGDNNKTINSTLNVYSELEIASHNNLPQQTIVIDNNNSIENKQITDEHPKQIQQWLQQILIESETEPSIQEIGNITDEISKFCCSESLVET